MLLLELVALFGTAGALAPAAGSRFKAIVLGPFDRDGRRPTRLRFEQKPGPHSFSAVALCADSP